MGQNCGKEHGAMMSYHQRKRCWINPRRKEFRNQGKKTIDGIKIRKIGVQKKN